MTHYDMLDTPIGPLFLGATAEGLVCIDFMDDMGGVDASVARLEAATGEAAAHGGAIAEEATRQLRAYFAGERRTFDLPLAPRGTEWQQQVWLALRGVPFGETVSYATIAQRLGRPTASRAVGAANGRNPLPIIVPCHRIIGANRTLTGYAGGLHRKHTLLAHEGVRLALPDAVLARAG